MCSFNEKLCILWGTTIKKCFIFIWYHWDIFFNDSLFPNPKTNTKKNIKNYVDSIGETRHNIHFYLWLILITEVLICFCLFVNLIFPELRFYTEFFSASFSHNAFEKREMKWNWMELWEFALKWKKRFGVVLR